MIRQTSIEKFVWTLKLYTLFYSLPSVFSSTFVISSIFGISFEAFKYIIKINSIVNNHLNDINQSVWAINSIRKMSEWMNGPRTHSYAFIEYDSWWIYWVWNRKRNKQQFSIKNSICIWKMKTLSHNTCEWNKKTENTSSQRTRWLVWIWIGMVVVVDSPRCFG